MGPSLLRYLLSVRHSGLEGTLGKSQEKGGSIVHVSCRPAHYLIVLHAFFKHIMSNHTHSCNILFPDRS